MASFGLDGRAAEEALGVTANKQIVPDDPRPPLRPSGLRLGTAACTTRGMSEEDMTTIAQWIVRTLLRPDDAPTIEALRAEVRTMCRRYPVSLLHNALSEAIFFLLQAGVNPARSGRGGPEVDD